MLKAQFSLKKGLIAFDRLQDQGFDSWTFKALGDKHPKWDDRRAALDKERAKLWLAMAEFTNGVEWLAVENYPAATACFVSVLLEFPDSVESLANLGYAKLMHYCDKLDDKDEIHFQNGQIVTAGFYKREKSIVRGEDVELWQNAIEALERADKLKPNQATVLVHLGVARLVTPRSIGMDVDKANLYLRLAKMAADDDSNLHDIAVANLAVAANAEGKPEEALALLDPKKFKPANRDVVAAANYTRAIALADSKKDAEKLEALKLFEDYLNSASHLSRWWGAAYREYETLAKTLEKAPKARGEFTRGVRSHLRMATGVTLRNGKPISIGDTAKQLLDAAGPGRTTQAVPSTTTQRIRYESEGLEFLVVDDKVVAIAIVGPEAKPLEFRGAGVSTNDAGQLRIGMSETALVALLGETVRKRRSSCRTCGTSTTANRGSPSAWRRGRSWRSWWCNYRPNSSRGSPMFRFRVALIAAILAFAPVMAKAADEDELAVRSLAEKYWTTVAAKDLTGHMKLWVEKGYEGETQPSRLKPVFACDGPIALEKLAIDRIDAFEDRSVVRIKCEIAYSTKTAKDNLFIPPGKQDFFIELRKSNGAWLIRRAYPVEIGFGLVLGAPATQEQRKKLIANHRDLVTLGMIHNILAAAELNMGRNQLFAAKDFVDVAMDLAKTLNDAHALARVYTMRSTGRNLMDENADAVADGLEAVRWARQANNDEATAACARYSREREFENWPNPRGPESLPRVTCDLPALGECGRRVEVECKSRPARYPDRSLWRRTQAFATGDRVVAQGSVEAGVGAGQNLTPTYRSARAFGRSPSVQ